MTTALCGKLFSVYMFGFNCKDDSLERAKKDAQYKSDMRIMNYIRFTDMLILTSTY
jgi:hypothetical protein